MVLGWCFSVFDILGVVRFWCFLLFGAWRLHSGIPIGYYLLHLYIYAYLRTNLDHLIEETVLYIRRVVAIKCEVYIPAASLSSCRRVYQPLSRLRRPNQRKYHPQQLSGFSSTPPKTQGTDTRPASWPRDPVPPAWS